MMRHLLAKDVRLVAPYLWLIVPAHVLWCLQASLSLYFYFWMSLIAALGWTAAIVMIEWRAEADRVVASLPVTRATIVRARYASALSGLALGAALYFLYAYVVVAVASEGTPRRTVAAEGASLEGVLAFVAVGYMLIITFLPFYFRFNLPLGALLFMVSAGLMVSVAMALGGFAGFSWSLSEASSIAWPAWLAAVAIVIALGVFSVWLSVRFYESREL
jgi:hypothetical protein